MKNIRKLVRRSSLIFPVNIPRFVEKAATRGADCLIMDLEDSVPLEEKEASRKLIKDYIPIVGKGGGAVSVRINSPIEEAKKDLDASIWPGLTCVALPKVESAEYVKHIDNLITEFEYERGVPGGAVQISLAVETALGVIKAFELASSSSRIVSLGIGAEDLTQEMGVQTSKNGEELWYARSKILMDAYAAGVQPMGIIGVEPFIWREPEKYFEAAVNSRKLGFMGAQSIHPAPIPYLNQGFSIPESEVAQMRKELAAFEAGLKQRTASVNVDGRMIDIASAERCRKVLERADAIADMEERKHVALKKHHIT
jgi:citrate lyase subunit beta / citryl-CoA lyase